MSGFVVAQHTVAPGVAFLTHLKYEILFMYVCREIISSVGYTHIIRRDAIVNETKTKKKIRLLTALF